jgi:hypothetical protein
MLALTLLPLSVLLGCPADDGPGTGLDSPVDTGEPEPDADSDADGDTDSDADADADADADSDADADAELSFVLDGALGGTALALTWAWPTEDGYLEGEVLSTAAVEGELLELSGLEVPSDALVELAPDHYPGLYAAMYVPSLFEDLDEDLEVDQGEIVVGAGLVWPLWLEGEIPAEAALLGIQAGWNAIDFGQADSIDFQRPFDLPVSATLWPVESITIGGGLDDSPSPDPRLSVRPGQADEHGTLVVMEGVEPLADIAMGWTQPWSLRIDGPPPEDHLIPHGASGWVGALEFLRMYLDEDGSGDLSEPDSLLDAICLGDEGAYLAYSLPLTSPTTAFYYAWMGMPVGWAALTGTDPESWVIMDEAQAGDLCHCEVDGAI